MMLFFRGLRTDSRFLVVFVCKKSNRIWGTSFCIDCIQSSITWSSWFYCSSSNLSLYGSLLRTSSSLKGKMPQVPKSDKIFFCEEALESEISEMALLFLFSILSGYPFFNGFLVEVWNWCYLFCMLE